MGTIQIDCHWNETVDKTMKKLLFQVTCFLYFLLTITQQINAQQKIGEMNPNQCSKSSTTREYFVKQGKFQTTNELIPPGCFAQLMTELNGDDSVAAVFFKQNKNERLHWCKLSIPWRGRRENWLSNCFKDREWHLQSKGMPECRGKSERILWQDYYQICETWLLERGRDLVCTLNWKARRILVGQ